VQHQELFFQLSCDCFSDCWPWCSAAALRKQQGCVSADTALSAQTCNRWAVCTSSTHFCCCCMVGCLPPPLKGGTGNAPPVASLLAMPRSLLVFTDEAYHSCLHGIEEV
jgi:hypothetical protein